VTGSAPERGAALTVAACRGLWRRTLLVNPDGSRDDSSGVRWVQSDSAYVDSRGFAGTLHARDGIFHWRRDIDLEAPADTPDEGEMHWDNGVLVETGVHVDYVEHWVRDDGPQTPCWAAFLTGPDARPGLLVRAGAAVAFATEDRVVVDDTDADRWPTPDAGHVDVAGTRWTVVRTEGTYR
jgi:hypothetical protein